MLFNSLDFALFLGVVLAAYHALPKRGQDVLLLAGSVFFYAWWNWRFAGLVLAVAGVDFLAAHGVASAATRSGRRGWLALSVGFDLGVLGVFKYLGFFADSAARALQSLGLDVSRPALEIVLPVGISFFTLQSLGHVIDVFRRETEPARSLLHHACFVTFFPQLLAGPIERSHRLLRQIERPRRLAPGAAWSGLLLLLWGLFKKVGVADNFGAYVDPVYQHAHVQGGGSLALATYLFAFQIYCDFSGYSDMAIGMARLFGIELVRNFRTPYLAASIREFWHRWHVSLSTWFRDYVYLPLGGSRCGRARWVLHVVVVFTLSGLWHGAAWTFVAWGALHALAYLGGAWRARRRGLRAVSPSGWRRVVAVLGTFHVVLLGWVLFRAPSLEHAGRVLGTIATGLGRPVLSPVLVNGGACMLVVAVVELASGRLAVDQWMVRRRVAVQLGMVVLLVVLLLLLGADTGRHFIYFQF